MPTTLTQDFSGLDRMAEAFAQAPEAWRNEMGGAMQKSTEFVHQGMTTYPSQLHLTRRSVYGTPFKTERQQRWFFAALSSGELHIPYERTGALKESWHWEAQIQPEGITGRNWTDSPYVKWVQDQAFQSKMFPNWETLQEFIEVRHDEMVRFFQLANERLQERINAL